MVTHVKRYGRSMDNLFDPAVESQSPACEVFGGRYRKCMLSTEVLPGTQFLDIAFSAYAIPIPGPSTNETAVCVFPAGVLLNPCGISIMQIVSHVPAKHMKCCWFSNRPNEVVGGVGLIVQA
jgi:hypothetical protein